LPLATPIHRPRPAQGVWRVQLPGEIITFLLGLFKSDTQITGLRT